MDRIHVSPRLIYASNSHGRFFDHVAGILARQGTIGIDHADRGYVVAEIDGVEITATAAPDPAPYAASRLDALIAAGASRIVYLNGCGSLSPCRSIGSLVLPTELVREEGTSFHYAPADAVLTTSLDLRDRLRGALDGAGVPVEEGRHWSTDAMYRETVTKVLRFHAEGVLSVEMELSALAAVAAFRGCSLAALLAVTDIVQKPRVWYEGAEEGLARGARVASEAAVAALL